VIKAIIFDLFGVLSTEGFRVFCDKYFKNDPLKRTEAQQLMDQSSLGNVDYKSFIKKLAALGQVPEKLVYDYLDDNVPNEPLFDYIRQELKPKYKISLLSNASANWLHEIFKPEDINLFDDAVISFEVHMTKPDPQMYKLAAKRLEVSSAECVFIDDIYRYCEGAKAVGMKAILYEDFVQMKIELEKILSSVADN
jgi:HAD superfamily hydrolase (TIGR01509 family)